MHPNDLWNLKPRKNKNRSHPPLLDSWENLTNWCFYLGPTPLAYPLSIFIRWALTLVYDVDLFLRCWSSSWAMKGLDRHLIAISSPLEISLGLLRNWKITDTELTNYLSIVPSILPSTHGVQISGPHSQSPEEQTWHLFVASLHPTTNPLPKSPSSEHNCSSQGEVQVCWSECRWVGWPRFEHLQCLWSSSLGVSVVYHHYWWMEWSLTTMMTMDKWEDEIC